MIQDPKYLNVPTELGKQVFLVIKIINMLNLIHHLFMMIWAEQKGEQ